MAKLFNRAKMTTSTTGSGTVTLGSASVGYQSFADAGVSNGDVVQYVIEEGGNFEIGTGTYSSTGTSLTRSPTESSNSNAAISLGGAATVSITAVADDLNRLQHSGSTKVEPTSTGATVTGNLAVTGTVDGRDVAADGTKLDGIESGATADQAITAGSGLTGGGTGNVTLSHADTSSQASVNGSGRTYIQDITLDTYGHVTGLATATETVVNTDTVPNNATITITAGNALTGGGNFTTDQASNETITINHQDTSSQASVNNSNGTVIQDVTLDTYGHITGLTSYNLDGRYYTETEADARFLRGNTSDTLSGSLTVDAGTSSYITVKCDDGGVAGVIARGDSQGTGYVEVAQSTGYGGGMYYNGDGTPAFASGETADTIGFYRLNNGTRTEVFSYPYSADTVTFNGSIAVGGTVDGRDVASDGSKLDGIESGATADMTASEILTAIKTVDGSGSGLDADTVDGYGTSTGTNANTIAVRQGSGYLFATYFNGSGTFSTSGATSGMGLFTGTNGADTYGRSYTAAAARTLLNVENGATADQTPSEILTAIKTVDGSGSGLDADLWDGNQFSTYLNQAVLSTSSPSFAGLNINGNLNAVDNIYLAGNVYHEGDTDTYLEFNVNQIRLITGGSAEVTIDPTGVRLGDSGNAYVQPVSGNYGSFQIDGGAHGGWEGYSIGGNWVFMSNNVDAGIYNDIDNEWMAYFTRNGATNLYHNGTSKFATTSTGITVTGDVNSTSDIRYKKNIETIDSALEKVQSLRGVTFDWDHEDFNTDSRATGVIAQDVEKVLPEAVRENEDGFKNVAYGNMVGLLIEAIKEQQQQIDALKKQLNG